MDVQVVKKVNVHSKALSGLIDEHIRAVLLLLDLASDIESVIQLIELVMYEEAENYKIDQINVVSDSRNNKLSDMRKGKFVVDIYYKHKNCFNITQLSYTIQK